MIEQELLKKSIAELPKILNLFLSAFKEVKEEIKLAFNQDFHKYISSKFISLSQVKTILHRQTPKYFYDIYQPQAISYNAERIVVDNYKKLEQLNTFVAIIGGPGSGKTTLLRHLFLSSLQSTEKVPIYIELRRLDSNTDSLISAIYHLIQTQFQIESNRIITKLLEMQKFIIMLDGFDELQYGTREKFIINLSEFIEKYPKNNILLTSRPSPVAELIQNFSNVRIENFTMDEALEFLEKQDLNEELLENLIREITEKKWKSNGNFLANPLLLSTYILTYKSNATIPEKNSEFYARVINALFSEHDSWHKNGYVRKPHSDLSIDSIKTILYEFSLRNTFKGEYSFNTQSLNSEFESIFTSLKINAQVDKLKEDLTVSYGILLEDSGIFQFIHRSLQDYLAAQKIKRINSANKELIYEKIYKLSKRSAGFEIENFISFLLEIDEYYFNKYFLLPSLEEFFDKFNPQFPASSILSILYLNIEFPDIKGAGFMITFTENPFRSLNLFTNIENQFTHKILHNPDFQDILKKNSIKELKDSTYTHTFQFVLENMVNLELFTQTTSPELISNINSEVDNLRKLKKKLEIQLKESLEEERKSLENL